MAGFHLLRTFCTLFLLSCFWESYARGTCRSKHNSTLPGNGRAGSIEEYQVQPTSTPTPTPSPAPGIVPVVQQPVVQQPTGQQGTGQQSTGTDQTQGSTGSAIEEYNPTNSQTSSASTGTGSLAAGTELRILPFGDSITLGVGSTNQCGYRGDLVDALSGYKVSMVGTLTSGSCANNRHAGYSGQTIQYLQDNESPNLATNPNIILLLIGTNDMNPTSEYAKQGDDPTAASQRYAALLGSIFQSLPKVVVLAAKIPGSGADTGRQQRDDTFNQLIAGVIQQQASQGHHCKIVDLSVINTGNGLSSDGTHPDDSGYQKIASIWADAIKSLDSSWIQTTTVSPVQTSRKYRRRRT